MFGTTDAARRRGFPQRGRWNCDLHLPAAAGLAGLAVMVATAAIAPAARTTAVTSASATVPQLAGVTVGIDGMKALARGLVAPQLDAGAVDQARSVASERSIWSYERASRSAADARRSTSAADSLTSTAVSAAREAAAHERLPPDRTVRCRGQALGQPTQRSGLRDGDGYAGGRRARRHRRVGRVGRGLRQPHRHPSLRRRRDLVLPHVSLHRRDRPAGRHRTSDRARRQYGQHDRAAPAPGGAAGGAPPSTQPLSWQTTALLRDGALAARGRKVGVVGATPRVRGSPAWGGGT